MTDAQAIEVLTKLSDWRKLTDDQVEALAEAISALDIGGQVSNVIVGRKND